MSGETAHQESGWTVDTLKQHFDDLRIDDQRAVRAAVIAVKEDNAKIATAMEKRFESVNEFRKTLSDQTATFLPRPEYDANHKALEDKIDTKTQGLDDKIQTLTDRINIAEGGRKSIITFISIGLGVMTIVLSFVVAVANGAFR